MSILTLKRLAVALGVLCVVLFASTGFLLGRYGSLRVQAAFADEQTQILDEMRTQALQSTSPSGIAGALRYTVDYYPSGSKQRTGSPLDLVVERHRAAVVHDIIAHLRQTSGQDLARVRRLGFKGMRSDRQGVRLGSVLPRIYFHLPRSLKSAD